MQQRSYDVLARAADATNCREILRQGSRTFYTASFLLPPNVRDPASALYAFCRLADDTVDLGVGDSRSVQRLRERLDAAYRGTPQNHPVDRAFAEAVTRFAMPRELPEALLCGLEWDLEGRRYETIFDLEAYATRVAGAVGAMMAVLMGVTAPDVAARACDLGCAMQLTNIARDVGEDARVGRLYLPQGWMREAGLDPEAWMARPTFTPELASVIERVLSHADGLYQRAEAAIEHLPATCRPGIRAALLFYSEIGQQLRRDGLDSVSRRAVVNFRTKLWLLTRAKWSGTNLSPRLADPCLEQSRFLVEALLQRPRHLEVREPAHWWDLHGQLVWVLDLFHEMDRHECADDSLSAPAHLAT